MKNGAVTGAAVCEPRPGTPVDAAVDLDGIWEPGARAAVDEVTSSPIKLCVLGGQRVVSMPPPCLSHTLGALFICALFAGVTN